MATIRKPIKIHEVKSYKEIPKEVDGTYQPKSIQGLSFPSEREMYVIKGKTSESWKQHEIGHIVKGHKESHYKPEVFVRQELVANLYAYDKTGSPKHILQHLKGIFNTLNRDYKLSSSRALAIIRNEMGKLSIPDGWKKDYTDLEFEVRRVFAKR